MQIPGELFFANQGPKMGTSAKARTYLD